jgi:hypothetical protein
VTGTLGSLAFSVAIGGMMLAGGAPDATVATAPRLAAALAHTAPLPDPRMHAALPRAGSDLADLIDAPALDYDQANDLIAETCMRCHNERRMSGNLSLAEFDVERAFEQRQVSEAMITKLRAGMMPPPGPNRPAEELLQGLAATLETQLDEFALANPNPGVRTFQRLNQAEYRNAVEDLLGLTIDPEAFLPPDTKSANFDNIADAQLLSPTLMDAYLNAAAKIARLAVGDPEAIPEEATYSVPRLASQWEWVEGAPFGTRGGVSAVHIFPADGVYTFRVRLQPTPTGGLFGRSAANESIEVSVDGERVALVPVNRSQSESDPTGMEMVIDARVPIRAGPRRVSAAFLPNFEGPVEDILAPVGHSLADTNIGTFFGITALPHLRDLVISGPFDVTGVSNTPSRERIFVCRPTAPSEAQPCARRIIEGMATRAYRRPLSEGDMDALMSFYEQGAAEGGFEQGVRDGVQAILASPYFIFRIERGEASDLGEGIERISDTDLASRLSFFLWGTVPDDELRAIARDGRLSDPEILEAQVERMLAAPAADRLGARFAAQWLRLSDIEKVHPDALSYPDFDQQLSGLMVEETERFFNQIVEGDHSVLELLTSDWTVINERLADHYEIPGVAGPEFRVVSYADARRRGLLGHGSVLTLTSHANRTSPVLRGKWVMEVLMGTPPPPPPPNVPELEESGESSEPGRFLTVREQMELHRESPSCNSCHQFIDPIGLSLENFDVTGRWRTRDKSTLVDASGELYDGTPLNGPGDLRGALEARPEPFLRNFTQNLMAYALGRRVEYYDQPTVRRIVADARERDYAISAFISGVVNSPAFQMRRVESTDADSMQ